MTIPAPQVEVTPGRPYLQLCKECNRRDATMTKAEKDAAGGTPLCPSCADVFDQWQRDFAAWELEQVERRQRTERNRAKARRRHLRALQRRRRARR